MSVFILIASLIYFLMLSPRSQDQNQEDSLALLIYFMRTQYQNFIRAGNHGSFILRMNHRITELTRLGKTSEIIESNS